MAAALFSRAQEIRDISTTVNLFRTGNAQVIQKWDVTVTSGTEWYIPIDNPGKSYIHDFRKRERICKRRQEMEFRPFPGGKNPPLRHS